MRKLSVHFLNVGHGDCTLIEFPSGRTTMVDINNGKILDEDTEKELFDQFGLSYILHEHKDPEERYELLQNKGYDIDLTAPLDYLKSGLNKRELFRFICTHPDMDHISGLHRLHNQEKITLRNFWDSDHSFEKDEEELENSQYNLEDWKAYQDLRDSKSFPKVLHLERHHSNDYYSQDSISILASTYELKKEAEEKDDPNHLSYVLKIEHGDSSIILGGDATEGVWQDIVDNFDEKDLSSTILKASHHGRDSGYHQEAAKIMNPEYTIVSVGKKPDSDASSKYNNYSDKVMSTRWHGDIVFDCYEDGTVECHPEHERN